MASQRPSKLPNGYMIRVAGSAFHLSEEEAAALAEAANEVNYARMEHNEFFPGVEIADAIESAWAGMEVAEYTLEGALAQNVLEVLSDEVVSNVPALAPLRDALRELQ